MQNPLLKKLGQKLLGEKETVTTTTQFYFQMMPRQLTLKDVCL